MLYSANPSRPVDLSILHGHVQPCIALNFRSNEWSLSAEPLLMVTSVSKSKQSGTLRARLESLGTAWIESQHPPPVEPSPRRGEFPCLAKSCTWQVADRRG
jgi:hypothetical protein